MKESFIDTLAVHLKAGTPVIAINTDETLRLVGEVKRAAWQTGDGTLINLKPEDVDRYKQIFNRHSPSGTWETYYCRDKRNNPALRYDSAVLLTIFNAIDDKLSKLDTHRDSKNAFTGLDDDMKAIDQLLNTVYKVVEWNMIDGFIGSKVEAKGDPEPALMATIADTNEQIFPKNCIFVFRDLYPFFETQSTPKYREVLRNLVENSLLTSNGCSHHIVLVQPEWTPHRDIRNCIHMLEFGLPNEKQLDREVTYVMHSIDDPTKRHITDELRTDLCQAMRGFTQMEAVNALAVCVAKHGGFVPETLKTVHSLQRATFSKGGVLTMVDEDNIESSDSIGGFENYMEFIDDCALAYTPEAVKLGMPKTKGCLLLGIPGTGKSLVARVTARRMKKPLLIYDFAAQFGSLVGQTEATQRQVLKQITAKGPCVVLLDEADKTFSGVVSGYQGDTGVKLGAFGRLLSWMASENEEAFLILTMNRTVGIPPEMLRAGRLDAVFYTTFPNQHERTEILGIHLKKNGADPNKLTGAAVEDLVRTTDNYVGAEIEQIVKKAVRLAAKRNYADIKTFLKQHPDPAPEQIAQVKADLYTPTPEELMLAKQIITPVARLDRENIDSIESFCKDTATPVSKESGESKIFKTMRSIRVNPSNN